MKPTKQAIDISFARGLDTKTDPKRVPIGKFVSLVNSIFTVTGSLKKRNGFPKLSALPDNSSTYLTTFRDNLTAIGDTIAAYNEPDNLFVQKGSIEPLSLSTLPLIRNNLNQTAADSVVAPNGLMCTVYLESNGSSTTNKYAISDSVTSQNIIAPTAIPVSSGTVSGGMRVYILGNKFIIIFTNTITGTAHLQYIAVNITDPTIVSANTDIAAAYIPATTLSWDAYVVSNAIFVAYNTTTGGQSVRVSKLTSSLVVSAPTTFVGSIATMMSVTPDNTNSASPTIYISFYDLASTTGYTAAVDFNLNVVMNPVQIIASGTVLNITSAAQNGSCKIFYEVANAYAWNAAIPTNYINAVVVTIAAASFMSVFASGAGAITVSSGTGLVNGMKLVDNTTAANIAAGTTFTVVGTTLTLSINTAGNSAASPGDELVASSVGSAVTVIRSVGLASKAFIVNGEIYFLAAYQSPYQPTYFLIDGTNSLSSSPVISAKLAYSNGGGYLTTGLPNVTVSGSMAQITYLFKSLIIPVNKGTAVPAGDQIAGVYSQTGVNLANFSFGTEKLDTAEIGNDLHLSGGFLWMYDGQIPVEHNFFLWPDTDQNTPSNTAVWSTTGGNIAAQPDGATNAKAYYVQFTYEWTDNQGNAFKSAPSIPIPITTTGALSTGSITYNVPALRLTYKVASPVKIVAYRWSVAQPIYYQTTSVISPTLNSTTVDTIQIVDTNSDATILGNSIIYTTGGVAENINAPASNLLTLFDNRLWLVDAEDPNLLWYSKQVIESTPVEMSDLFTYFVAPTTAAIGSTGPITAISVLDDKLVIFKKNAIYYINGSGPDNTGANSQYSQPTFITSTIGCSNQKSIVFMPDGLMFQSDKGIWLLERGLNTIYIGADVQGYNSQLVVSAKNIPKTNQVRFMTDGGITLMYDYYERQWGTFSGIPGISSCIFQDFHTFINDTGEIYQELPNSYLDGSNPVLMSFKTAPIRLGDLQNFQRTFWYFLLGTYYSPHKLLVKNYFDYEDTPYNSSLIEPTNYSPAWGEPSTPSVDAPWGQSKVWGGGTKLENWRVFAQRRCMAIAVEMQEIYDATLGEAAGAGLTLSGLSMVCGFKSPFKTISSKNSVG